MARIVSMVRLSACVLAILALGVSQAPAQGSAPQITWRVENPFRLFTDPQDSEVHRATFEALSEEERQRPVLNAERALAERHPDGWAATMFKKTCWDAQKVRYGCPDYPDYEIGRAHV